MKDVLIVLKHTLIGLFVAVVAYPVVHETGHILATLFSNGKVVSFSLWPLPSVGCISDSTNIPALVVTSLAGIVFPMMVSGMLRWTSGSFRFGALIFSGITVLSTTIGVMTSILRMIGITMPNDDITTFINLTGSAMFALILMLLLFTVSIYQTMRLKPKTTILKTLKLV